MKLDIFGFVVGLAFGVFLIAGAAVGGFPPTSVGSPLLLGIVTLILFLFFAYGGSVAWGSFFGGVMIHPLVIAAVIGLGWLGVVELGSQMTLFFGYLSILYIYARRSRSKSKPKYTDLLQPRCSGPYK